MLVTFPPSAAIVATKLLAKADYTIANRVSEDVAAVVQWSFNHHQPWIAHTAMSLLQSLDEAGSLLIALVAFVVAHTT